MMPNKQFQPKNSRCARICRLNCGVMRHRHTCLFIVAACMPAVASANAIIPYMAVPWGQLLLFPAVVVIEATVLWRAPVTFGQATLQSFLANLASTIVGAGLYLATMPLVGDRLFSFWFKGNFASETIRGLVIALGFAAALGVLSWLIESAVVARLRKTNRQEVAWPCAKANLITYGILVLLALGIS
jgi:hypothetical protein